MPSHLTEAEKTRVQESESVLPRGHGELILVVDDDASIREVARRILVKYGYQVLTASDGAEALSVYSGQENGKIRLVITDIRMPRMEGISLIRTLKKSNPEVSIIATSGLSHMSGESERDEELRLLGVGNFLDKPFTAEDLLRVIHSEFAG